MRENGSALYTGRVVHRRLGPVAHLFRYRVLSVLLELDELDALDRRLSLFSVNRFNLFSFHERDHGPGDGRPLKEQVEAMVCGAGIDIRGGSIALLCYPRVLGYAFNPLSVYFCRDVQGRLAAVLYEVTNTFRERRHYLFPVGPEEAPPLRHGCAKTLYVSPFIGMNAAYEFTVVPPGERLAIAIRETEAGTPVLNASFTAVRETFSDGALARLACGYFALGLKVIGGIHWQAFRLWRKGLRVHRRGDAIPDPVSAVDQFE